MVAPINAVSQEIDNIDLSSTNSRKFKTLKSILAPHLGVRVDEIYTCYISRASNVNVRLKLQLNSGLPIRIAIGICGKDDFESISYKSAAADVLKMYPKVEAVVFLLKNPASKIWESRLAYGRPSNAVELGLQSVWPMKLTIIPQIDGGSTVNHESHDCSLTTLLIQMLMRHKNLVLEGVPGTGKSFAVEGVVNSWQDLTGRKLAESKILVLHPSISYEDLVQGLRPDPKTKEFIPKFGRLAEIAQNAIDNPGSDFLLVLDEMNRANVPKALGETLLLLESTKRASFDGAQWQAVSSGTVNLAYTGETFFLPDNLYVLANMNSSDRSVTGLDSALRRRFRFVRLEPDPVVVNEALALLSESKRELLSDFVAVWVEVNEVLLRTEVGPDALIGHSFALDLIRAVASADENSPQIWTELVRDTLKYSLLPQIIDNLELAGREDLLISGDDSSHTQAGRETLSIFHSFLSEHGLKLRPEGSGLTRRLIIGIVDQAEESVSEPANSQPAD